MLSLLAISTTDTKPSLIICRKLTSFELHLEVSRVLIRGSAIDFARTLLQYRTNVISATHVVATVWKSHVGNYMKLHCDRRPLETPTSLLQCATSTYSP